MIVDVVEAVVTVKAELGGIDMFEVVLRGRETMGALRVSPEILIASPIVMEG